MKKVGGRPSIDYLFAYAADVEERRRAPQARARRARRARRQEQPERSRAHLRDRARTRTTPDAVRDVAFQRMGEFPKEQIVPKLYTLFEPKKWKIRWVAGRDSSSRRSRRPSRSATSSRRLPKTPATKMGMTEPLSYGWQDPRQMEGEPTKPRDHPRALPHSKEFGAKLAALGYF